jgi:hypothetical protein
LPNNFLAHALAANVIASDSPAEYETLCEAARRRPGVDRLQVAATDEGFPASKHLIEQHAEREHVLRASIRCPEACSGDM